MSISQEEEAHDPHSHQNDQHNGRRREVRDVGLSGNQYHAG